MRPARKGPENLAGILRDGGIGVRFNEAGPQGAGKRPPCASTGWGSSMLQ